MIFFEAKKCIIYEYSLNKKKISLITAMIIHSFFFVFIVSFLRGNILENKYQKRILFVGMPDMALVVFKRLIDKGFNIAGIVPPDKENNTYQIMEKLANNFNIPFLPYSDLKDSKFLKTVKKLKADIGVVCSFNKKFPKEFLETTKDGFLNCHPSLLPYYRGGNPYSAVINNHEKVTGVTLHFMNEDFDMGDIVLQIRVDIMPNETMGTLFNKLNFICADALEVALDKYEQTSTLPREPQPQGDFVKAPNFESNSYETFINWNDKCENIEAKIRSLNPFIIASTIYKHQKIDIYSCEYEICNTNLESGVVADLSKGFGVSCNDGIIHIKSLKIGTYIITDGEDFVKRFSPKIGEKVG